MVSVSLVKSLKLVIIYDSHQNVTITSGDIMMTVNCFGDSDMIADGFTITDSDTNTDSDIIGYIITVRLTSLLNSDSVITVNFNIIADTTVTPLMTITPIQ